MQEDSAHKSLINSLRYQVLTVVPMKTADFRDMLQSSPVKNLTSIAKTTVASISCASIVMRGAAGFSGTSAHIHQQIILVPKFNTISSLQQLLKQSTMLPNSKQFNFLFYSSNIKSVLLHTNNYGFVKHNSEQTLRTTTIYFI